MLEESLMTSLPLLPGVSVRTVATPRLTFSLLEAGAATGVPVLFVHGNVSSARFFEETLAALAAQPQGYHALAPDLRGFGDSEAQPVDATRGLRDFSDDLFALVQTLGLASGQQKAHFVGWSMGAGVVMQYAIDHPETVASCSNRRSRPLASAGRKIQLARSAGRMPQAPVEGPPTLNMSGC